MNIIFCERVLSSLETGPSEKATEPRTHSIDEYKRFETEEVKADALFHTKEYLRLKQLMGVHEREYNKIALAFDMRRMAKEREEKEEE